MLLSNRHPSYRVSPIAYRVSRLASRVSRLAFPLFIILHLASLSLSAQPMFEHLERLSRIDLLPQCINGAIVRQISSYDTTGGNDDGFSGKYSFIRKEGEHLVIADLQGSGVIQRIWTPTPTHDTIQFFFDNEASPTISLRFIDLFNGSVYPFIKPVVGNEVGGYYCYIPLPFRKSCKILFKGSLMQFIQIQYLEYLPGHIPASFSMVFKEDEKAALAKAAAVWSRHGHDAVIAGEATGRGLIQESSREVLLKPGLTTNLFERKGEGRIVGIEISPHAELNTDFKDLILEAWWDGHPEPAITCPLTDFFGYAFGQPAMKSLLLGVDERKHYCAIPMPFAREAKVAIRYTQHPGNKGRDIPCSVTIRYSDQGLNDNEGRFYARWKRDADPAEGLPFEILNASGKGHYIGTLLQAQGRNSGMTIFFEGDDVCTIDGEMRLHGTGSEDFFNGGWYAIPDRWDRAFNLPVHGCLAYSIPLARTAAYRFYPADKLPFERSLQMTIEHGPEGNKIPVDYTSVAFWYSDVPLDFNPAPDSALLTAIEPPQLQEYWIQLLPISALSSGASISRVVLKDEKKNFQDGVMRLEGSPGRYARFELEVPHDGRYTLYLSYFKGPDCGAFAVNQRQIPVTATIEAFSAEYQFIEKEYMGELFIQNGINTITVQLKSNPPGLEKGAFCLQRIFLERMPPK